MVTTIDTDSHLREEYFMDEVYKLEGEFADKTPKKIAEGKYPIDNKFEYSFFPWTKKEEKSYNHEWIYHPDHQFNDGEMADRQIGGYDMEKRLQHNEAAGVDKQLIFPTNITAPATAPGPLGAALARSYNNWVKDLVKDHTDVMFPIGIMPAGCPEAMAAEAEYCVNTLGFQALHMACFTEEHTVDDEVFHPFYATVEKLGVPLFAHPNSRGPSQSMFKTFTQIHALGRPFNSCMVLIGMVLGGIFDKFPNLKVVFFECTAEWPLYWMHRMDDDHKFTDKKIFKDHGMGSIEHLPSHYMRKNCWYSCESDEGSMTQSIEELGIDRILFASDYPHYDAEYPNTVPDLMGRNDITPVQKEMILCKNAEALLGW
jgi:predicted TIM-barrel fold metal-dependent hydrolase